MIVYAGSGLHGSDLCAEEGLTIKPPLVAGDLSDLMETCEAPHDVLIIDGEFGQELAVTVTEIREALRVGHRLYGASSMGALRAVECRPLGMVGLGRIHEAYLAGELVSDADLALVYDPDTFEPLSVPLVNVRYLAASLACRVGSAIASALVQDAAAMHFRERTVVRVREILESRLGGLPEDLESLFTRGGMAGWDLKRQDAHFAVNAVAGSVARPGAVSAPALLQSGCAAPADLSSLLASVGAWPPNWTK